MDLFENIKFLDNAKTHYTGSMNIMDMYFNDVMKYPMLTEEEELYYSDIMKEAPNKKLLLRKEIDNCIVYTLNLPLLFYSLCDNSMYDTIIDSLLLMYSKLQISSDKAISVLEKYQSKANEVSRALNKDEIKEIFNFDVANDKKLLDSKDLLDEIKYFIMYKDAYNKLLMSNLRLPISISKKYNYGIPSPDLYSEGNIGIFRAMSRHDNELGSKFSTYATWWIRSIVRRYNIKENELLRMPEHISNAVQSYRRKIRTIENEEQRELSNKEISERLGMPIEVVDEFQIYAKKPISISESFADDESLTLEGSLVAPDSVEDTIMRECLKDEILELLDVLNEREKLVIKMRYGLGEANGRIYKLDEIAKMFGVSRQCVHQIETRALRKMKYYVKRNRKVYELKEYI